MIVMIDEPVGAHHGGDVAAPVFKRIAEQTLRYMSLPPDVPSYAPQYVVKGSNLSGSGFKQLGFPLPTTTDGVKITFTPAAGVAGHSH